MVNQLIIGSIRIVVFFSPPPDLGGARGGSLWYFSIEPFAKVLKTFSPARGGLSWTFARASIV